ncbi:hypothetical protein [Vulcanisaeta sp. JCM 16161]
MESPGAICDLEYVRAGIGGMKTLPRSYINNAAAPVLRSTT